MRFGESKLGRYVYLRNFQGGRTVQLKTIKLVGGLVGVAVFMLLSRSMHLMILDPAGHTKGPLLGIAYLMIVAALVFFVWRSIPKDKMPPEYWGFSLNKKAWPNLTFALLFLFLEWLGGSDNATTTFEWGTIIPLSAVLLVSDLILRVWLLSVATQLFGDKWKWQCTLAVIVTGALFSFIHPLDQSLTGSLLHSVFSSAFVFITGSVLFSWVLDFHYVARVNSLGSTPVILLIFALIYVFISGIGRFLFKRRIPSEDMSTTEAQ